MLGETRDLLLLLPPASFPSGISPLDSESSRKSWQTRLLTVSWCGIVGRIVAVDESMHFGGQLLILVRFGLLHIFRV
jgi:hypothetical protein